MTFIVWTRTAQQEARQALHACISSEDDVEGDMLKSRTKHPPGGWKFVQPQTGWSPPSGLPFDQVVQEIIKHRQSNGRFGLSTERDEVAAELEYFTEKRLRAMPNTKDWYVDTGGGDFSKKASSPARPSQGGPAAGGGTLKRTVTGIKTLLDWLGTGARPVAKELANARAQVCSVCPMNRKGTMYQWVQSKVADGIETLIGVSKDMKLATAYDDKLEICQACDCHIPLKVWVPLKHIKKTLEDDVKAKLHPSCWILKEKPQ